MPEYPTGTQLDNPNVCFQVAAADNVATALGDIPAGDTRVTGSSNVDLLSLTQDLSEGHKVAVVKILRGEPVIKFGVPIGRATVTIEPGQWVHLHNCTSNHDERSQTLDTETGAATDTLYE